MRIAFTGHRPDKLGGYDLNSPYNLKVRKRIKDLVLKVIELKKDNKYEFYTGGALGVDTIAFEVCQEIKKELEGKTEIRVVLCIPFEGFHKVWINQQAKDRLQSHIDVADDIAIVDLLEEYYTSELMYKYQKRNEFMVNHCDLLIAVHDGSSGGTKNCIEYAEKIGKKILTIGI